jgi:predicted DNA-binding protein
MPISLRMPPEKEEILKRVAAKTGKTKTALILEALDERLGLAEKREDLVRRMAGWMSQEEAEELREAVNIFNRVGEGDWP